MVTVKTPSPAGVALLSVIENVTASKSKNSTTHVHQGKSSRDIVNADPRVMASDTTAA
ncbi:hypothetical protein [Rhodococcoides fascians]|uniref:hypothetical protein n=1 Tax=Rhodococcoides fascians TaxID=1828 RepID=UPI0012D334BF|nr:hypothetical protein [Rhodococcus fascians]